MRISTRVAIILVIFSGHALAKGKKAAAPKQAGESMNSNDPIEKEQSDEGPFAPKGKTGELKEEEEKQAEVARIAALPPVKPPPRDKAAVFGNVVIGFGRAPEAGAGAQEATGRTTAATFIAGGHYDLSPSFTLGLRIPWTVGSARQVDGSSATTQALGSPELMGEDRVTLGTYTRLPIFFGIGIPLAQGAYDTESGLRQAYMNDFGDAASGYRDGELFAIKRLPLIAGVGLDYKEQALSLHAATKFTTGIKLGGAVANATGPAGTIELKSVTFRNVTSGGIAYQVLEKPALYGALDGWLAYSAINALEFHSNAGAGAPTRIQVVFEPRVGARFGKIAPSLGYIFPIGGRLADKSTSGLELHCDIAL
jgi:hypothetical protein